MEFRRQHDSQWRMTNDTRMDENTKMPNERTGTCEAEMQYVIRKYPNTVDTLLPIRIRPDSHGTGTVRTTRRGRERAAPAGSAMPYRVGQYMFERATCVRTPKRRS